MGHLLFDLLVSLLIPFAVVRSVGTDQGIGEIAQHAAFRVESEPKAAKQVGSLYEQPPILKCFGCAIHHHLAPLMLEVHQAKRCLNCYQLHFLNLA